MAEAILGGDTSARKPTSIDITNLPESWTALAGLVEDPLIDIDSQIAVLAMIDETGSASFGDLMAILPGHAAPAKIIEAFIRHGVLVIEPGLIDAQSMLQRKVNPPLRGATSQTAQTLKTTRSERRSNKAGQGKVHHLALVAPEPDIFFASGVDRSYFMREPRLRKKGIYIALYGRTAYVGRSGDTACRIAWGAHLRVHGMPDRVIAAVDRHGVISDGQTRACERLAARWFNKQADLSLLNPSMPTGYRLSEDGFAQAARFVARFIEKAQTAGLFSNAPGVEDLFVSPTNPDLAIKDETTTRLFVLDASGITAKARNEKGKWVVLKGSQVRAQPVPSAGSAALKMRQELLYEGGLERRDDCLVLTHDVAFNTASGAANFVAGSRFKPEAWRALPDGTPGQLQL